MKSFVVFIQGDQQQPGPGRVIKDLLSVHFSEEAAHQAATALNDESAGQAASVLEVDCDDVVEMLRACSSAIADMGCSMTYCGFNYAASKSERRQYDMIRTAAWAIHSSERSDHSTEVECRDVAALVRYIADQMEK